MLYRPARGAMWDPSILWHNGRYHAFMMYNRDGANGLEAQHCLLAVSEDGVHWRDEAVVIEERERDRGGKFFKAMVARCGDRFILNHGVARPEGQDTLRFYESADLRNWTYLSSCRPDPRWYGLPPEPHRWDHMYMLPKVEGRPQAGYWGFPVAIPKPFETGGVGRMQSPDGRAWEPLPPARIEWPADLPRINHLEWGGCERIGGAYPLIGGAPYLGFKGYGMYAFTADAPEGPFRPDPETIRLCGNSHVNVSWLAVWCRGNGELLVSNYASMEPGSFAPWLLPLRRPVVDAAGRLRLGWWPGNEALKGRRLPLPRPAVTVKSGRAPDGYGMAYLDAPFNPQQGVVIEGTVRARAARASAAPENFPAAGFLFDEDAGQAMAVLMGIGRVEGRETHVGRLQAAGGAAAFAAMDITGRHCATVTGLDDGHTHSFRLLSRLGLFELYVDDRLMQTFFYKPGAGRVGFVTRQAEADFSDLRAWAMTL
jgi:hypothetical protein